MKKIPDIKAPLVCEKLNDSDSKFILLKDGADFDIKMQYPALNMESAVSSCYIREELYEKLLLAKSFLPEGYNFRIWDAWRPFALQLELYYKYRVKIIEDFGLNQCSDEEKEKTVRQFVSFPLDNIYIPPVHTTGGAVDLTVTDSDGNELEMGTEFDAFTDKTETSYFEAEGRDTKIRDNRRILYNSMTEAGFTNLPSEWWHYDYGDRFWAYYRGTSAFYKGVFTLKEVLSNEKH